MTEETQEPELTEDEQKLFEEIMSEDFNGLSAFDESRRHFLKLMTAAGAGALALQMLGGQQILAQSLSEMPAASSLENLVKVAFKVNGVKKSLDVDS